MSNLSEEVKKNQETRDLQKKIVPFNISTETGDVTEQFKRGIERLAAVLFPGKHSKTKAQVLMDVIQDYMLFNGESAVCLKKKLGRKHQAIISSMEVGEGR